MAAAPLAMLTWIGAALAVAACHAPVRAQDPFRATGELIALSGGDGGARNACFTCHGQAGGGDGLAVPGLAGLSRGYLARQLDDYAIGRRPDAVMTPIARRLSEEDRRKVSAYYEGLSPPPRPWATPPVAGARLYADACAACHGTDGQGDAANPPLAGQPPTYLAEQMTRFARAERRNDPRGVMLAVSRRLSPPQIAAVSAYAASLRAASPPTPSAPAPSPPARRDGG